MNKRYQAVVFVLLAIGFLDELVFSAWEASVPLVRNDLGLSYAQIGLLLSVPTAVATLIEPILFILSDIWDRKRVILGGGLGFAAGVAGAALAGHFTTMIGAFSLLAPSSGAFVAVSQGALVDDGTGRQEQQMARWALAGSLGVVCGPLLAWLALHIGLGWRGLFALFAVPALALVLMLARLRLPTGPSEEEEDQQAPASLMDGLRGVWEALGQGEVRRWLLLLEFANLLLDVLLAYLALYLVDVVGLGEGQAALAVALWTGVGLAGDALIIPLLERVSGVAYVRASAGVALMLFAAFLLLDALWARLIALALLGLFTSGWYAVLQGRLYAVIPGRSGTTLTLSTLGSWAGSLLPLGIGLAAQRWGLGAAVWLMAAGPVILLIGLPRAGREASQT